MRQLEFPKTYVVTPDVNVWLTVAEQLGAGFDVEDFFIAVRRSDKRQRDVFALFATLLTPYEGVGSVEVWSGVHIMETVLFKAMQDRDAANEEERGLGWDAGQAQSIVNLIVIVCAKTGGNHAVPRSKTYCEPPLDHEDGEVMQCARMARYESGQCARVCVTYDKAMVCHTVDAVWVTVVTPQQWCEQVQSREIRDAMRKMIPVR